MICLHGDLVMISLYFVQVSSLDNKNNVPSKYAALSGEGHRNVPLLLSSTISWAARRCIFEIGILGRSHKVSSFGASYLQTVYFVLPIVQLPPKYR